MFLWMGEEIEERRQKYQAEALFPPFVRAMTTERDDDDDATRYRRSSDGSTVAHRMRAIMIKLGNCGTKLGQRFRSNSRTNPDRSHRRFGLGRVSRLTFRHSFCQSRLATLRAVQAGRLITQSEEEGASGAGGRACGGRCLAFKRFPRETFIHAQWITGCNGRNQPHFRLKSC